MKVFLESFVYYILAVFSIVLLPQISFLSIIIYQRDVNFKSLEVFSNLTALYRPIFLTVNALWQRFVLFAVPFNIVFFL